MLALARCLRVTPRRQPPGAPVTLSQLRSRFAELGLPLDFDSTLHSGKVTFSDLTAAAAWLATFPQKFRMTV